MAPRRGSRRDGGETLVEIMVSIAILGLAAVAILDGIALASRASDITRKEATGGAFVRSYAEAIEQWVAAGHYQPCAAYNDSTYSPTTVSFTLPPGGAAAWKVTQDQALTLSGGAWSACTPTTDPGVQRVKLTVKSTDGRAVESLFVVLRKPCTGTSTCTS